MQQVHKKPRKHHRFIKDRQGSALIEFALIGPIFLWLLIGIIEFGLMYFAGVLIESGTRSISRFAITGEQTDGKTREQAIRELFAKNTFGFIDMSKVKIVTTPLSSFTGTTLSEPGDENNFVDLNCNGIWDAQRDDAGQDSEVVAYTVSYRWDFITPLLGKILGKKDYHINLESKTVVQNEPYSDLPLAGCPS